MLILDLFIMYYINHQENKLLHVVKIQLKFGK